MYASSADFNAGFGERLNREKRFISSCLQNSYPLNIELVGLQALKPPPPFPNSGGSRTP